VTNDYALIVVCGLLVLLAVFTYAQAASLYAEAYALVVDNCFIGQKMFFEVDKNGNNTITESEERVYSVVPG